MTPTTAADGLLTQIVTVEANKALELLRTEPRGLSSAEAARRLAQYGPNEVRAEQRSLIGLSIFQEYRAERALAALRALLPLQVHVWRDGALVVRPASELVPGDVVVVRSGDIVPAVPARSRST